jgi:hypothetical protein
MPSFQSQPHQLAEEHACTLLCWPAEQLRASTKQQNQLTDPNAQAPQVSRHLRPMLQYALLPDARQLAHAGQQLISQASV